MFEIRTCRFCEEPKPLDEFRTYKSHGKIYRAWRCKSCELDQTSSRARREREETRIKEVNKEWNFLYTMPMRAKKGEVR